jgi:hypothetical protein
MEEGERWVLWLLRLPTVERNGQEAQRSNQPEFIVLCEKTTKTEFLRLFGFTPSLEELESEI